MTSPALYGEHPILEKAQTEWLTPDKGVRIRFAKWVGGDKGTIHIFNGRTEYIEKYCDLIADFYQRGYAVTAHDWRGQGLSTRNDRFPKRCHIDDFSEFQRDADAVMLASRDLPHPRRLFCHSMGGAIGTRFLLRNPSIESVVMSAPMLGIYIPLTLRPFLRPLNWAVNKWDAQWKCVLGTNDEAYELYTPFRLNLLTGDPVQYDKLQNNVRLFPELALGGPTYHWYYAAQREMNDLSANEWPKIPTLIFLGTQEKIVDPKVIQKRAQNSENIRLVTINNARHETYIETPEIRREMHAQIESFWFTN